MCFGWREDRCEADINTFEKPAPMLSGASGEQRRESPLERRPRGCIVLRVRRAPSSLSRFQACLGMNPCSRQAGRFGAKCSATTWRTSSRKVSLSSVIQGRRCTRGRMARLL